MKKFISCSIIFCSFLFLPFKASAGDDPHKQVKETHAGKRADSKFTHISAKYAIKNRLHSYHDPVDGGFYSFRRHDYTFHFIRRKKDNSPGGK
ncbi:MAG: hypothetical protein HY064_16710 [Bacteroidetes bacterium]|nr:hypothetical protein [Bacteroidota bacterium]